VHVVKTCLQANRVVTVDGREVHGCQRLYQNQPDGPKDFRVICIQGRPRVAVWDVDRKPLGLGWMETVKGENVPKGLSMSANLFGHPKITLDNGTVKYGCECWWRVVSAKRARPPIEKIDLTPMKILFEALSNLIEEEKK
jgi:hypothetical protein